MRMVNVVTCQGGRPPLHHTFTECQEFKEDAVRRNMRPTFTHLLELPRLANYDLSRFPTINRDLFIYLGEAKGKKPGRKAAMGSQRLFLRRVSHSTDFFEGGAERMLAKATEAMEIALRDPRVEPTCPTSMFISMMAETDGTLQQTGARVTQVTLTLTLTLTPTQVSDGTPLNRIVVAGPNPNPNPNLNPNPKPR